MPTSALEGKKEMKMSFADSQHWRKCELKFDKCRICMAILGKLGTESNES